MEEDRSIALSCCQCKCLLSPPDFAVLEKSKLVEAPRRKTEDPLLANIAPARFPHMSSIPQSPSEKQRVLRRGTRAITYETICCALAATETLYSRRHPSSPMFAYAAVINISIFPIMIQFDLPCVMRARKHSEFSLSLSLSLGTLPPQTHRIHTNI